MRISLRFTGWLALLLVLAMTACGTMNVGSINPGQLDDQRQISGVKLGGFEVIRFNADGSRDSALNPTLNLRLEREDALVIGIRDNSPATVAVEVKFDGRRIHPDKAVYHGLLGSDADVITASFLTQKTGVAGIGQTCVGTYRPGNLDGDFVTVYFANGACREVSRAPGRAVDATIGNLPNLELTQDTPPTHAAVKWYAGFNQADGDQNMEVNIADITPIGQHFNEAWPATWACLPADYDGNTLVNLSDITPIGQNYQATSAAFLVEGGDDGSATKTTFATINWADAVPADGAAADGVLAKVFKSWTFDFTSADWITLVGMDANTNGFCDITITPMDGSTPPLPGVSAVIQVGVSPPLPPYDQINITGYDVKVLGATNGGGTGDIFGGTGGDMAGNVVANQALTLTLNNITGTYQGVNFDSSTTFPTTEGMTQADYDAAYAAVQLAVAWTINSGGVTTERHTGPWFTPDTAYAGTGNPGAGVVFPDYDPESTGADAQGILGTNLPVANQMVHDAVLELDVNVPAAVAFTPILFEVGPDPAAPVIDGYFADPAQNEPLLELNIGLDTSVYIHHLWGSGGAPPLDATNLAFQMMEIQGGVPVAGATVDFTWTDSHTALPGEFHIEAGIDPDHWFFTANVAGGTIQTGANYLFRLGVGPAATRIWQTINLPGADLANTVHGMLITATPPPPEEMATIPGEKTGGIGFNHDVLLVMYSQPIIRRDGRLVIDQIAGTVTPVDLTAFDDILKTEDVASEAKEFIVNMDAARAVYPKIVFQANTLDPAEITAINDPDAVAGIGVLERRFDRLVVDILAITPSGGPGDPEVQYAFKLFNSGQTAVGSGHFLISPLQIDPIQVTGVNWGINLWNREDFLVADRGTHFTNHTINADTITTSTPDVLWVEYNGGYNFDWDEYWNDDDFPPPTKQDNVSIHLTDNDGITGVMNMYMSLNVIGLGATGNVIAIRNLDRKDGSGNYIDWSGGPDPWPGILTPTHTYVVSLDDPHSAGDEWTFTGLDLDVTGNNPNG